MVDLNALEVNVVGGGNGNCDCNYIVNLGEKEIEVYGDKQCIEICIKGANKHQWLMSGVFVAIVAIAAVGVLCGHK
jgi:hypothetical protein